MPLNWNKVIYAEVLASLSRLHIFLCIKKNNYITELNKPISS